MDDGGFSKKRQTICPLLNKPHSIPSGGAGASSGMGVWELLGGGWQRPAAADGAGEHLAGAAISASRQRGAVLAMV